MTFGEAALARMQVLGLRQSVVAKITGISQPHVCRLLHDQRRPTPEAAHTLADALRLVGPDRETFLHLAGKAAGYTDTPLTSVAE